MSLYSSPQERLKMWNDYFANNKSQILKQMQDYVPSGIWIEDIEIIATSMSSPVKVTALVHFIDQNKEGQYEFSFHPRYDGPGEFFVFTKKVKKALSSIRSCGVIVKDPQWSTYIELNQKSILASISELFAPEYTIEINDFSSLQIASSMRPIIQATLTIQKVGKPDLTVQTTCQSAVSKSFVVEDDLGKTYLENALPVLQSLKQKLPDKFRNLEIQEKKTAAKEMFIHDAQSEIDQFYKLFPKTPASLTLDETSLLLCLADPPIKLKTWDAPIGRLAETLADGENAQQVCTNFWKAIFEDLQANPIFIESQAEMPDQYRPFLDSLKLTELFLNETKLKTADEDCLYFIDLSTGEVTFECKSFSIGKEDQIPVYTGDFEKLHKDIRSDKFQDSCQFLQNKLDFIKSSGYNIERRAGKGLLSGKGKFRITKRNHEDFVDIELKLPAYKLKNEEWKSGISEFFANIAKNFEQGLNDQLQQTMDDFPSWIERDIALIISGTSKMSVYALTHYLAGKAFTSEYRPFRPEKFDGKYRLLYSVDDIEKIVKSMDERNLLRIRNEYSYSRYSSDFDYDSVSSLKKTETASLLDQTTNLPMADVAELQKKAVLTDYEAQYIYNWFHRKSTAERTIADFTILTKVLTAKGFLSVYFMDLALLFSKEGSLFGSLIRAYARNIQDKRHRQAMETIAKYADMKPATIGIPL